MRAILDVIDLLHPMGQGIYYEIGITHYFIEVVHESDGQSRLSIFVDEDEDPTHQEWIDHFVNTENALDYLRALMVQLVIESDPVYTDAEKEAIAREILTRKKEL